MNLLVIGLALMALVWAGALAGLAWSWRRTVTGYEGDGRTIPEDIGRLNSIDVARLNVRRHTVGWSAFYSGCFLVLALIELPLWASLGMVVVLGTYYGQNRIDRGEAEGEGRPIVFSRSLDKIALTVIVTLEWCGYFGVLLFAANIAVEAVR
jgi:hypothetical protein